MSLKKISKIVFHPNTIKIVSLIFIVGIFFILPTYAESTVKDPSSLGGIKDFLSNALKVCSRGWVILAILAGKLMTNERVYGSIIHMDVYLWKIWNIMKNFANFALVGIVLYNIVKNLVGKDKMDIKDIITKTLLAGILIQASWFLMGAVVDISTIATSAVGAFPSSFLQGNTTLQTQIKSSLIKTPTKYKVDGNGLTAVSLPGEATGYIDGNTWDQILPTYNSISGPLIYLGFSVFKFQNYMAAPDGVEQLSISVLLRVILIIFYTLGLALLFIANIIRVVFLWLFVIGSPIIILFQVFKMKGLEGESSGGIGKYLNFGVMANLIFKPVIFVAGFSMILILVVSIQSIMNGTLPKSFNGVTIGVSNGASTLEVEGISSIKVSENGMLGADTLTGSVTEVGQTIFVNLLVFFLTAFLMRQFIKISATSGKGPIEEVMRNITGNIEKFAGTLPIIPLGGKGASLNALKEFSKRSQTQLLNGVGLDKDGQRGQRDKDGNFVTNQTKFKDRMAGGDLVNWRGSDFDTLTNIAGSSKSNTFFSESIALAKERKGGLSPGNDRWLPGLQLALSNDVNRSKWGFKNKWGNEKPEEYFDGTETGKKNRKALYKQLGGNAATGKSRGESPTWEQLQSVSFYATKKTGSSTKE